MAPYLRTEQYLAELANAGSITFTVIRQELYSTSFPIYTGFFNSNQPGNGVIRIPHDGWGKISRGQRERSSGKPQPT